MDKTYKSKALQEALKVSPDNIPLLKMYAEACLEEWSLKEGRQAYERILALDPKDHEAQLGVARILFQKGDVSEAMVRTEALLKESPHSAETWLLKSRLNLSEGRREEARESYTKAKDLDPKIVDAALEKELNLCPSPQEKQPEKEKLTHTELGWKVEAQDDEEDYGEDLIQWEKIDKPKINFQDVGGMQGIKEEIRMKIIYPMNNPELFKAYGKKMGGGVLLYGPPGCGKTLISRATAGEIQAYFISVGLHQILDMYIGNSEKNLHEIFELARRHKPSVLFIDEIDALAASRSDMKQSAARSLINQFLAELDGDINSNEGVLILGATNAPWHIDPAFRRPGRFDRIIFVPTPDLEARREIIKILMKDKPVSDLDIKTLAQKTEGFSGADLKAVFDQATEASLTLAMKENRIIPLTTKDLLKTAQSTTPSSRAWFESAKNYALYANQSGLYDPILAYLGLNP